MATIRRCERTLAHEVSVRGISFLSGLDVTLRFRPAAAGTGLVFIRADLPGCPEVPARVAHVIPRPRRTTIERGAARVEMIEHVLAALGGLHIDNCRIDIDGPETPGCDGSSLVFVEALTAAGLVSQDRPREILVLDQTVTVGAGAATLTAAPAAPGCLTLSYRLDYGPDSPIGSQSQTLDITPESFRRELASCRTFLLAAEADAMRQAGIGRRTTESDLLIFGPNGPIGNTLRYPDECVRHKMMDLLGDLALAGKDVFGHFLAERSGHQLNAALVRPVAGGMPRRGKPGREALGHPLPASLDEPPGRRARAVAGRLTSSALLGAWPWPT